MIAAFVVAAQLGAVSFHTTVEPETVFVGQQVNYDAITLLDDAARARLRSNPEVTFADVNGVTTYDFPFDIASIRDTTIDFAHWRRYSFHRAIFPLTAGRYTVESATLRYMMREAEDYYSPQHAFADKSAATSFVALALPAAGRPVGFNGLVGDFRDTVWLATPRLRMGDPVTLTLRTSGIGNIRLVPRPDLVIPWATVAPSAERVAWDSTGTSVRGSKEFDWTVVPTVAGDLPLPQIRIDYFEPTKREYRSALTPALQVGVDASSAVAALPPVQRDTIGDSPFPTVLRFFRSNPFAIALGVMALALIVFGAIQLGRRHGREDDI